MEKKYYFQYIWKDGQQYPSKLVENSKLVDLDVPMTAEKMTTYFLQLIEYYKEYDADDVIGVCVCLDPNVKTLTSAFEIPFENIVEHCWGEVES